MPRPSPKSARTVQVATDTLTSSQGRLPIVLRAPTSNTLRPACKPAIRGEPSLLPQNGRACKPALSTGRACKPAPSKGTRLHACSVCGRACKLASPRGTCLQACSLCGRACKPYFQSNSSTLPTNKNGANPDGTSLAPEGVRNWSPTWPGGWCAALQMLKRGARKFEAWRHII